MLSFIGNIGKSSLEQIDRPLRVTLGATLPPNTFCELVHLRHEIL